MDVTSLLNSNPAAAEQRKRADSSGSKAPSRSRTPWDAGGYSLPINTAAHVVQAAQQHIHPEIRYDDPPVGTPPCSPKHRFTDSRSSLSSFASSLQSTTTHSRYSSTSTLNSNSHAHHKSHGTDILSPELRSISQTLEESCRLPLATHSFQANDPRQDTSLSPTGSTLEQLALVAESQSSEQQSESMRKNNDGIGADASDLAPESGAKRTSLSRPSSPSDAILIKRTSIPSLRVNTGDSNGYQQQMNYLSAPLRRYEPSLLQNKSHKRTSSAPQFGPTFTSSILSTLPNGVPFNHTFFAQTYQPEHYLRMEKSSEVPERNADGRSPLPKVKTNGALSTDSSSSPSSVNVNPLTSIENMDSDVVATAPIRLHNHGIGPQAEPTPPSSLHPDHASPTSPPTFITPNTPPTLSPEADSQTVVCMYIPNCDTGSQLRKAISHIFGRNKMCTRQIPDHVWVHYCRKHYQRARYRNPKEYAKLQCDLVQEQLARIHAWSEDNRDNGRDHGVVIDWTLAVRRREQKRVEENERRKGGKGKRKRTDSNADDEDEDDDDIGCEPATAVPDWLRERCRGQRYSTGEVCEIFNRLHHEILNDTGSMSFPDLEILPTITASTETPKTPKGYAKRPSATPSHRRAQSMGVIPSQHATSWVDEPSMHDPLTYESSIYDPPTQKRRRPNSRGNEEYVDRELPNHLGRSRLPRRSVDIGRRSLPHHEMYPHPEEHMQYGYQQQQHGYYPGSTMGFQAPLHAPTPQREMGYSTASYLEDRNGGDLRRPMHGRSQSDVGFMHGQPQYGHSQYGQPQPPPGYHHDPRGPVPSRYQPTGYAPQREHEYLTPSTRPQIGYPAPAPHGHEYSPSTTHSHLSNMRPPPYYTPSHGRHQSTPMMQPTYGSPTQTYQQSPQSHSPLPPSRSPLPPTPRVTEDEKTQDLFRDRR